MSLETEKTLSEGFFSHSVRFDVYVEGSTEVIDFEIQLRPSGRSVEFRFAKHRNALPPSGSKSEHENIRIRECGCGELRRGAA